jgi:hypothetical protein
MEYLVLTNVPLSLSRFKCLKEWQGSVRAPLRITLSRNVIQDPTNFINMRLDFYCDENKTVMAQPMVFRCQNMMAKILRAEYANLVVDLDNDNIYWTYCQNHDTLSFVTENISDSDDDIQDTLHAGFLDKVVGIARAMMKHTGASCHHCGKGVATDKLIKSVIGDEEEEPEFNAMAAHFGALV